MEGLQKSDLQKSGVWVVAAAPTCGYRVQPRSVDVNPSTFAIYRIRNRIKQFYCIQYSRIHKCTVQRTVVRASRAAGDPRCTLFGTVVSMVFCHSDYRIGVIPTAESHRTSVTQEYYPHRTNRVIPLAAITA